MAKLDSRDVNERIAEKERELEELRKEQSTGGAFAEYPKSIPMPGDPSKSFTVSNAEEEAKVKAGQPAGIVGNTFDKTVEEQEAERVARAEADKDAARAKSRLAGPEDGQPATTKAERKVARKPKAEKPGFIGRAKAKITGKGK